MLFFAHALVFGLFPSNILAADATTQTETQTPAFNELPSKVSLTLRQELFDNLGSSRQGILVRFPKLGKEELETLVASRVFEEATRLSQEPSNSDYVPNIRMLRRNAVNQVLRTHAEIYQAPLRETLDSLDIEYESLWIGNSIYIRRAPIQLIHLISEDENVITIDANENVAELLRPVETVENASTARDLKSPEDDDTEVPWNLALINADKAWEITKGEGIVVATIDSGVKGDHQELLKNYRGYSGKNKKVKDDYNWYDPAGKASAPTDGNGHGTHTMGTIAGANVGVAPGVKWIAARGCNYYCSEYDLTSSGQWVICPKKLDKSEEDCNMGADVVSNSWGGSRGNDWYEEVSAAWQTSGVIPVFAQGNAGPSCSTANSPGDLHNVLGVASVDQYQKLSSFSSRGPGIGTDKFPLQKPDISAPGDRIKSSYIDGGYRYLSGTSMACPHIAGVVALMLSVNPNLSYDDISEILKTTAVTETLKTPTGRTSCGEVESNTFPNYHYGFGLVDAFAAVNEAKKAVGSF